MGPPRARAGGNERGRAGGSELGRAAHIVGVDVGVEGGHDLQAQVLRECEVRVDIARRVDHDGMALAHLDQV